MQLTEEAIQKVFAEGGQVLVPCESVANQESMRAMLFHLRKRLIPKSLVDSVGISKFNHEGKFFVRVYAREISMLYEIDANGNPVPIQRKAEDTVDALRIVELMKRDGKTESEIEEFMQSLREKQ